MSDVTATRLDLGSAYTGEALRPGDPAYDEARALFNGMIDRRPALIARCSSTEDVVAAIALARREGLPLSVYGGGHGVTGSAVCEGGVMIDLRGMAAIEVDPGDRVARVGGGATWGEVDMATQAHGLALTGGRVTHTGVGGLTLGSGSGWLERKLGLTCDSLLSCEVVTADGRVVRASHAEHRDLFWGLRGGGGNFGVVTEFEFELHPVGPLVYGGMLAFPFPMAAGVLAVWRDFMARAPDEIGSAAALITAPDAPFVPEPARGHPMLGIICCYAGAPEVGAEAFAPLKALGPVVDLCQPMPYVAVQQLIDAGNPKGMRNYWSADFLADLPDEAIEVVLAGRVRSPSPMAQVIIAAGGGAIARVPNDAMAFGERDAAFTIHYLTMWESPEQDAACIAWTKEIAAAMKPWTTGRVYLNYVSYEGADRVRSGYGEERYARLVAIKDRWDPDNVFRMNQNIRPSRR
jgi:FAD/FMN-containing dehydrogenase